MRDDRVHRRLGRLPPRSAGSWKSRLPHECLAAPSARAGWMNAAETMALFASAVLLLLSAVPCYAAGEAEAGFSAAGAPGLTQERVRFLLDEDVIPETFAAGEGGFQYAAHGRFITRSRCGQWFCGFISKRGQVDRNWLALAVSQSPTDPGCEFRPPILLVGREEAGAQPLFSYEGDYIRNACLLVDDRDVLHVFYDDAGGVQHLEADAGSQDPRELLARRSAWRRLPVVAGAGALLWDAGFLPSGEIAVYYSQGGTFYEKRFAATPQPICEAGFRGVVHIEASGVRHFAFERDRQIYYVRSSDGANWTDSRGRAAPEMIAAYCSSYPSIAATPDGAVVVAYQGEGKVALKYSTDPYSLVRRSGGCTISYAVLKGGVWRQHDLVRSREILLKRFQYSGARRRTSDVFFEPFMEEFWRPGLALDKHGVIWMFFPNTTRRHAFFSRFEGETFGERHEARGPYDDLSRVLLVQKDSRGRSDIGTLTVASSQVYFDRHEVPEYRSDERRRVVFLDNMELAERVGVDHEVGRWEKHPEPLMGSGIPGDFAEEFFSCCTVTRSAEGFWMDYMAQLPPLRKNSMPGRGFSRDGFRWQRLQPLDDSRWTLDGGPFPNGFWRPVFLEDRREPDPMRRYKGLLGNWRSDRGVEVRAWDVVASPDGMAWHTVPDLPITVTGDISWNHHLMRDEEDKAPERRYKAAMLVNTEAGRAVAVFTSPDLIHWTGAYQFRQQPNVLTSAVWRQPTGPLAIHPDAAESPWEEEVHDAPMWRENGLLMFHYDAFRFDGNQHVEKALAVSRDGRHYWRVLRGAVNLPHGACGAWDSGRVRTGPPVRVGDELWLYYCGMPAQTHHDIPYTADDLYLEEPMEEEVLRKGRGLERGHPLRPLRVGLAKLRVDGWAYLQLTRGRPAGHVTTIPFEYRGGRLVVNGSGLGRDGLSVEVLAADTMEVVGGFSEREAVFSSPDGISSRVSWRSGETLAPGTYRLRFVFRSLNARLYAFGFEPDLR